MEYSQQEQLLERRFCYHESGVFGLDGVRVSGAR